MDVEQVQCEAARFMTGQYQQTTSSLSALLLDLGWETPELCSLMVCTTVY